MSIQSFMRSFRIPHDQRANVLTISIAILTLIVTLILFTPRPATFFINPPIIIITILALYLYIKAIIRKELIFEITDYLSVLRDIPDATLMKNITIYYKTTEVPNLHTALLKVQNKGNALIEERDFHSTPITINFPQKIKLRDAAIKDRSQLKNAIAEPELNGNKVIIEPFSLAAQEWFHVKFTFESQDQGVIEKLKEIDIPKSSDFSFDISSDVDWQKKVEKWVKRQNILLTIILFLLSVLSIIICTYVWFFSDGIFTLSLPYQDQVLLICGVSIPYFGLVLFMIMNRITPKSSL